MKPVVLILDDEPAIGSSLRFALENDYKVMAVTKVEEAIKVLQEKQVHVMLLDWRLGGSDGLDVLAEVKSMYPQTSVIMMTAYGTIESSVEAIKRGAYHYITKPLDIEELDLLIKKALEHQTLYSKIRELNETIEKIKGYDQMIGESPAMRNVFSIIERVKDIDSSVLIFGESGTGKELVARALHRQGKRKDGPFVSVNCAAIPEALLESELFGYAKGAFTGAVGNQEGKVAAANGGTLFLDEIGDMPASLQAKMLRVLQEKEFTPLGSTEIKKVNVRIISATNKNLSKMVAEGLFREDLFFRLNVIPIELPLLSERKEDLRALIPYFLKKYAEEMQRPLPSLSQEAWDRLLAYDYPGNVRQLSNILEYAVAMAKGRVIAEEDLPISVRSENSLVTPAAHSSAAIVPVPIGATMKEAEKMMIEAVLKHCEGSRKETAKVLGISERSLRNKLQIYREENS
ncbi:regulator [Bacillus sp. FJAT-27231]|uniref:sigma-54-dependent transcriptional regulator n=1 Tax=Bacillus sp. FJAT-27231 TaxID=1679168 RepID=UPI00067135A9|nr:sigma-54 dependent transcriptional regulator [Bacillus sp. FJAT-27231]KMY52737.1 regulator [Bacillus sp. FJAT-27231]